MFIQQGKTNWVMIIIVALIAGAVGGSLMVYVNDTYSQEVQLLQIAKINKKVEPKAVQAQTNTNSALVSQKETAFNSFLPDSTNIDFGIEKEARDIFGENYDCQIKDRTTTGMNNCLSVAMKKYDVLLSKLFNNKSLSLDKNIQENPEIGHYYVEEKGYLKTALDSFSNYRAAICHAEADEETTGTDASIVYGSCYNDITLKLIFSSVGLANTNN